MKQLWKLKLLEKQNIDGKYYLKKLLGAGGFGGVYLADEVEKEKDTLIRQVAVKLIPPVSSRAEQELKTSISLQHPHVLRFFACGRCQLQQTVQQSDGTYQQEERQYLYLVMELADSTLEDRLTPPQCILSEAERWDLVESLISALIYLHSTKKIAYRDMKPANVLRVGTNWKLSDFGIVRYEGITTTLVGTEEYAPPEAYSGNVSCAWDLWSLGIIIVEMLTGTRPSVGMKEEKIQEIVSKLPPAFAKIVKGCLHQDHEQRWTAEELEDKFIIPQLVSQIWESELNPEMQAIIVEIVNMRPKLKEKINAPNILIRALLEWTKFQHPLLTQLLEWVCNAQGILAEGQEENEWIERLVRGHIQDWDAQKLAGHLDHSDSANSFWRELKQKDGNPLALVDEFLAGPRNFGNSEAKVKKIQEILDEYQPLSYHLKGGESQPNFQRLILEFLNRKFSEAKKIMAQNQLEDILNTITNNSSDIEAIVILGLKRGMIIRYNSDLEANNQELDRIIRSQTFINFAKLKIIPDILDNFGTTTNLGSLEYVVFTLNKGAVIANFTKIKGNDFAICFISTKIEMLGLFIMQSEDKFEAITEALTNLS